MIGLIVALLVVGILIWAVETLIPIPDFIKKLIYVLIVLCVVLYILQFFGLIGYGGHDSLR